jgi:predicted DNA-binding transcriptional regulator AlpA
MRLLTLPDLKTVKGINYTPQWINELIRKGLFPAPFKMGEGSTGRNFWTEEVIDEHLAAKAGAKRTVEAA